MRRLSIVVAFALIALAAAQEKESFLERLGGWVIREGWPFAPASPPVPQSGGAANAVNALGFKLLGKARGEAGQDNVVYSPLSISSAFALVYFGAEGSTKSQLESVFGFQERSVPDQLINKAESFGEGSNGEVTIANRAYIANEVQVKSSYTNAVRRNNLRSIDFSGNPEGSRQEINGFVGRVTRQLIPEVLPGDFVTSQTRFVVVNAVYFKGTWQETFPKENTFTEKFRGANGEQDVEFMAFSSPQKFNTRPLPSLESWILELPYVGKRFSMFVILPNEDDGWRNVESKLSGMNYADLFKYDEVSTSLVNLPKFSLEVEMKNLKQHVIELGAPDVFSGAADMSGITDSERLPLTDAVHVVKIRVDEEGTEAAAATALASSRTGYTGNEFIVDHPFLFFVVDKRDGAIFFQGTVTSI
ncbi:hypothetical protein BSKO_05021 [Bryopsis sp. KO-2023]|nr:hypothetical protein BSKO_05021 [Bryopsis sp. KO-2023]